MTDKAPTITEPSPPRTVAKGTISRLAALLALAAMIALGPFRILGLQRNPDVALAHVVRNIQNSNGVVYRERLTLASCNCPEKAGYSIVYRSPYRYRAYIYNGVGNLWQTLCVDLKAGTYLTLFHDRKGYRRESLPPGQWPDVVRFLPPEVWLQQLSKGEQEKLPPKIVDEIPCEGIKARNLKLDEMVDLPIEHLVVRLWISTATNTPALLEAEFAIPACGTVIIDQFQWNVSIPLALFEPKIPADYRPM